VVRSCARSRISASVQARGFQPTNKKSRFTDMQILTMLDGKIAETTLGSGGLKYFLHILDGSVFEE
jgi:hypothetical protein